MLGTYYCASLYLIYIYYYTYNTCWNLLLYKLIFDLYIIIYIIHVGIYYCPILYLIYIYYYIYKIMRLINFALYVLMLECVLLVFVKWAV